MKTYKEYLQKIPWPLVFFGILGLVLLIWGSFAGRSSPKTKQEITQESSPQDEEEKLRELLSSLGLGSLKVMITYQDNGKLYLATDIKTETEYDKNQVKSIKEDREIVRMRQDNGETGYILQRQAAKVSGVVITLSKKISTAQKLMLIEAMRALWDLPLGRIVILGKE